MSNEFNASNEQFQEWWYGSTRDMWSTQYQAAKAAWLYRDALAREEKRESAKNLLHEIHTNAALKEELVSRDAEIAQLKDKIREMEAVMAMFKSNFTGLKVWASTHLVGEEQTYIRDQLIRFSTNGIDVCAKALNSSPDSEKNSVDAALQTQAGQWQLQRQELCAKLLVALSAITTTPLEGYGCNIDWAVSDTCKAIEKLAQKIYTQPVTSGRWGKEKNE